MSEIRYRRCILEKPFGRYRQRRADWLPECLAVAGMLVKCHIQSFVWDNDWLVMEVGEFLPDGVVPDDLKTWEQMPSSKVLP